MASQDIWLARAEILNVFGSLKRLLGDFKIIGGRMDELKVAYIDDVAKRAELTALLAEDPVNTIQSFQDEYTLLKTALEWIRTNFPTA